MVWTSPTLLPLVQCIPKHFHFLCFNLLTLMVTLIEVDYNMHLSLNSKGNNIN